MLFVKCRYLAVKEIVPMVYRDNPSEHGFVSGIS